jgi:hypothetical protein
MIVANETIPYDAPPACTGAGLTRHPCLAAADALLAQAARFIAAIPPSAYARPCPLASGGTIGKHVRHCLDHFSAALGAIDAPDGPIDYDHRERDVPMETSPAAALAAIVVLRSALRAITADQLAAPVTVRVMVDAEGGTVDLPSTLGRELAFATHHALHHHAMMKFIADSFGLPTPADFGKAPSTLEHERRASATLHH